MGSKVGKRFLVCALMSVVMTFQGLTAFSSGSSGDIDKAYAADPLAQDTHFSYTDDASGTYLTNGGLTGANTWNYPQTAHASYTEAGVTVGLDDEGYVTYTNSDGVDEAYLKKSVTEDSSTQGLFEVSLDIKGNEITNPIDVVLVVDYSSTMEGENLENALAGINDFLNTIAQPLISGRIQLSAVAYNRTLYSMGGFTTDAQKVLDFLEDTAQNGTGTFIQKGLYEAQRIFAGGRAGARQLLVHIGDGSVNCSYLPVSGATEYPNNGEIVAMNGYSASTYITDFQTSNPQYNTSMTTSDANAIKGVSTKLISNHTIGTAIDLKKNGGIEIFSIGVAPSSRGSYTARNLATNAGRYMTIDENLQDLSEALADIASQIDKTISAGTVTDPMGEGVILQKASAEFSADDYTLTGYRKNGALWVEAPDLLTDVVVSESKGTITLENLDIGLDERIVITYKVRLDTEADDFNPDAWYPANQETTLSPQGAGQNHAFPIPSIKAPSVTLSVEKIWNDTGLIITGGNGTNSPPLDYSGNRPSDIDFVVERSSVISSTGWKTSEPLSVGASDSWQKTVSEIIPAGLSQMVKLPAYNNKGENFIYSISEVAIPDNEYTWTSSTAGNNLTITNTLKTIDLNFTKLAADTDAPLAGAEFQLDGVDSSGSPFSATALSDVNGNVTFGNVPPGTYTVTELTAPAGYELLTGQVDVVVFVNKEGNLEYALSINGTPYEWNGELYNFPIGGGLHTFLFTKLYENGKDASGNDVALPFDGVSFTLSPILRGNGPHVEVSASGGKVDFTGVASGIYLLTEDSGYGSFQPISPIVVMVYWDSSGDLMVRYMSTGGNLIGQDNNGNPVLTNRQQLDLALSKTDDSTLSSAVDGAEFELRDNQGNVVAGGITQSGGTLLLTGLTQGEYTLVETITPSGYLPIDPIPIRIGYASGSNTLAVLQIGEDTAPSLPYQVVNKKVIDVEFGKRSGAGTALSGAEFTLTDTGNPSSIFTAISDNNGIVSFKDVSAGTYTLHESTPPGGYEGIADVAVVVGYRTNSNVLEVLAPTPWANFVAVDEEKTTDITFAKQTEVGKALEGITFELRSETGDLVSSAVSDRSGSVTFTDVPKGNYYLIESGQPEYLRELEVFPIEVFVDGQGNLEVNAPWDIPNPNVLVNHNKTTGFSFEKVDQDGNALEGAVFELHDAQGNLISTSISDNRGLVEIGGLIEGSYRLTEKTAPSGYAPIKGSVALTVTMVEGELVGSFDLAGHENLFDGKVHNYPSAGAGVDALFKKVGNSSSGQKALAGATFRLSNFYTGTPSYETTSDAKGILAFTAVESGLYLLEETGVPSGYKALKPITVAVYVDSSGAAVLRFPDTTLDVDENGYPIIVNEASSSPSNPVDPPSPTSRTGDAASTFLWFALLSFAIAGLVISGGVRRRCAAQKQDRCPYPKKPTRNEK